MKVAIPELSGSVAPRFEVARSFLIAQIAENQVAASWSVECNGSEGYHRVRLLQIHQVGVLICDGIKGSYSDMLKASGVTVISGVSAATGDALRKFSSGRLTPETLAAADDGMYLMCHEVLVERARELFQLNGYDVSPGPGWDAFLVDLVAEISCPVCRRPVRVAICCAAHTYRTDREIVEFCHATPSGYHARVYICPPGPSVLRCCREYGVELIDPDREPASFAERDTNKIPLLREPVAGHPEGSRVTQGERSSGMNLE